MHQSPARHTRTFILRIWREYLDETPPIWRGEVEDTRTQETARFSSLEQMNAIVHAWSITESGGRHLPRTDSRPDFQSTRARRDGR